MIKKTKIIILAVIILILVAGGFFWWWQGREIKGSPEDYVIRETPEGKIIENKKAGLSLKVPEGWEAQKIEDIEEGSLVMQTSDIEGKKNKKSVVTPPLTEGCGIEITITYKKMNFEEIREEAKEIHWMLVPKDEKFEKIILDNKEALKNTVETEASGPMMAVYVPTSDKVYTFTLIWASDEKEECMQEFDKFLKTVSINSY